MKTIPVIRALAVSHAADLAAEARRSGVSPEDLYRLLADCGAEPGGSRRQLFAVTRVAPAESVALRGSAGRRGVLTLPARGYDAGATVYVAATEQELRGLIAEAGTDMQLSLPFGDLSPLLPARGTVGRVLACRRASLPLGDRPLVMGVLNVTPDSFSDGGAFAKTEDAVARAWEVARAGADLIDIGGESTRPGAEPVPASTEMDRVLPVIAALAQSFPLPISIDTYKGDVARQALASGADIVNDVTGLHGDESLAEVAADADAPLVISHIRGTPRSMQEGPRYADLMAEVAANLLDGVMAAQAAGVAPEAIILDPGIGFGKTLADNLELLRRLPELASLGAPLLVGVSRKSFIGKVLDRPPRARLEGSLAAAEAARAGGASILRVHDVAETVRFLDVLGAIHGWAPHRRSDP